MLKLAYSVIHRQTFFKSSILQHYFARHVILLTCLQVELTEREARELECGARELDLFPLQENASNDMILVQTFPRR